MKRFIAFILVLAIIAGLACAGKYMGYLNKGNSSEYLPITDNNTESASKDKRIIFLGSSVTLGMQAKGNSFVDFLEAEDGIIPVKEAVSGTTLVDIDSKSYISRMKTKIPTNISVDMFICQLSTNDATKNMPLGDIDDSFDIDNFDTSTIIGSIEYIIAYAKQTWNCPVVFYTGTDFGNELYDTMVSVLYLLKEKWNIGIIDLYHKLDINSIEDDLYYLYMNDPIHPTMKGYKEWWTPVFREYINNYFEEL